MHSLDASLAGAHLKPFRCHAQPRDMMNFAAALGEINPLYYDDTGADPLPAHPLFPIALTWPLLRQLPAYLADAALPAELLATQVHYSEQLVLKRPVRAGDELEIRGRIASLLPHRAGTLVQVELAAATLQGKPVFAETTCGLLRGVRLAGATAAQTRRPGADPDLPARPVWVRKIQLDPLLPYLYDGCSGISFPIHTSRAFARKVGLPGIILHGSAVLGLAVRELVQRELAQDPRRVRHVRCRFAAMVTPGSSVRVRLRRAQQAGAGREFFFDVLTAGGTPALRDGVLQAGD